MSDDWRAYGCILFAGVSFDDETGVWTLESEKDSKRRLTDALRLVGVKCKAITFPWIDEQEGQRLCECYCMYDRPPYRAHHDDFFLPGLCQFSFESPPDCRLEFCLQQTRY